MSYKALYREPTYYYVWHNLQANDGNCYDWTYNPDYSKQPFGEIECFVNTAGGSVIIGYTDYMESGGYVCYNVGISNIFEVPTKNFPDFPFYTYISPVDDPTITIKYIDIISFQQLVDQQMPYWLYPLVNPSFSLASAQIKDEKGKILVEYTAENRIIIETRY